MWEITTYWFDVSIVLGIFTVGNILLGHFEEHKPKWRRLLKVATTVALALWLSSLNLRGVFYAIVAVIGLGAAYIHIIWLPKNGINGWTGEPKDKYLELVNGKQTSKTRT